MAFRLLLITVLVALTTHGTYSQPRPVASPSATGVTPAGGAGVPAVLVSLQFDNKADRVGRHQDVVTKYIAEKLCKIPFTDVQFVPGSLVDQSTTLNHQSVAKYYCKVPRGDVNSVQSHCKGWWAQHELKDEIKDHTTPDISVQKINCTITRA